MKSLKNIPKHTLKQVDSCNLFFIFFWVSCRSHNSAVLKVMIRLLMKRNVVLKVIIMEELLLCK